MDKPIICCFKIKSATLLIGIFDLVSNKNKSSIDNQSKVIVVIEIELNFRIKV
jgi:hypothetical protein